VYIENNLLLVPDEHLLVDHHFLVLVVVQHHLLHYSIDDHLDLLLELDKNIDVKHIVDQDFQAMLMLDMLQQQYQP